MIFTVHYICSAITLFAGSAIAVPSPLDWKFARGWDGVTSDATSIGTPLNSTGSSNAIQSAGNIGGIFLCSDSDWMGTCGYAVQPLRTCIVLGTDWNKKISSLGPDPGTLVEIFATADCTGDTLLIANPGGNLDANGWNDRVSSFVAFAGNP